MLVFMSYVMHRYIMLMRTQWFQGEVKNARPVWFVRLSVIDNKWKCTCVAFEAVTFRLSTIRLRKTFSLPHSKTAYMYDHQLFQKKFNMWHEHVIEIVKFVYKHFTSLYTYFVEARLWLINLIMCSCLPAY